MKSLLFTDKFAPHPGGTAIIYYNWVKHCPPGYLSVVAPTVPGRGHSQIDRELPGRIYRVPFINIPKLRMPLCWLFIFFASAVAVFRERPDILHAGQPLETGWIAWFWSRVTVRPFVLHCFGDDIPLYWRSPWVGAMMRFLAKRADRITVISVYSKERLLELGIPVERIALIYPGVDAPPDRVASPEDETSSILLTVGRLIERKGQDRVIEALPAIRQRVPNLKYVVVGGGEYEPTLRRLAEVHSVADRITFTGPINHEEVEAYYRTADVFIHPNRQLANGEVEGFGMVFLEASSFGLPVIGGNTGGTPDAVCDREAGFLVDPNSLEQITECAVVLLTDDALRARMGIAGRAWAAKFTWEAAAARLQEICSGMAGAESR